jgi:hypothetical protein
MGLTLGDLLLGAVSGLSRLILLDRCTSEWVREFVVQMCKLSCFLGRYRQMCRNVVELCDDDDSANSHCTDQTYIPPNYVSTVNPTSFQASEQDRFATSPSRKCRHPAREAEYIKVKAPALLGRTTLLANAKLLEQGECPQIWSW